MTKPSNKFVLSAAALAVSALLAACGGGEAGPPPDVVAPTLAITDNVSDTTATGAVTFTFTFSEDVGGSFAAEDILVTGGTAGAFTKVDATHYTLVVTPTENATGTITVNVAAAKFTDLSSNANTAASTASQGYNTVVVTPPPAGTGTLLISWDEEPPVFTGMGAYGDALPSVDPAPAGGTGKALKILKPANASVNWGGVYFGTPTVPFTADRKTLTARVYSTRAGAVIRLKVEIAGVDGSGVEVAANEVTGAANTWTTLTWNLAGVDPSKSYNVFAITPDPEVQVSGQSYWIEDITLAAAGAVVTPPPAGTCVSPNCIDFSGSTITFSPFENGGGGTVGLADDPANAANRVAKFVKKPGDGDYFGTVINGIGTVTLSTSNRTVTMRVRTPAAGTNFLLKLEGGAGGATTEIDAVTTKANEWETLSFTLPTAGTYTTVVVFPGGRSSVTAEKTMYIDDLTFPSVGGGSSGGGSFTGGVFAGDYVGSLNPADNQPAKSTQGGDVGFFVDSRLFANKAYDYGGLSGTAQNPGGVPNFYYGLGLNAPAITDGYIGAYVKSPGNAVVNVASFANLKVTVWGNDELFNAATFPQLQVILQGPAVAGCSSASGGSEVTSTFRTTTQGAASVYTLPLSGFTIQSACSGETTAAQVLANIAQFNIVLKGTNIQYVRKDNGGVGYTNGLNVGPIKFE